MSRTYTTADVSRATGVSTSCVLNRLRRTFAGIKRPKGKHCRFNQEQFEETVALIQIFQTVYPAYFRAKTREEITSQ